VTISNAVSIAQSSKLEGLFSLKRGKRDVRALSFEVLKMSTHIPMDSIHHAIVIQSGQGVCIGVSKSLDRRHEEAYESRGRVFLTEAQFMIVVFFPTCRHPTSLPKNGGSRLLQYDEIELAKQ